MNQQHHHLLGQEKESKDIYGSSQILFKISEIKTFDVFITGQ